MAGGQRPDTRIVLKPAKGEGGTVTLAAFWTDGDRPSGGLDRRIKRMKLELEDGTIVQVDNTKGSLSHYVNLYLDRPSDPRPRRDEHTNRQTSPMNDDDIPW
jgi:hypothetical protein